MILIYYIILFAQDVYAYTSPIRRNLPRCYHRWCCYY
jgi:hypothetical protein